VYCERLLRSKLRGKRAKWKLCFFASLHFEDCFAMRTPHSLQLAAGSFNRLWLG